jgi:tRNA (adenine22-N1)-methyltransferase
MRSAGSAPLSRRLEAVAAFVPEGARVADVGAGHGLLALWLVASGRARSCVATEADRERLARIGDFPSDHPRAGRLERRAGDGLQALRPEDRLDVAVLAGLGAHQICRILAPPWTMTLAIPRLVLQPQSEAPVLRRWLLEAGFRIAGEAMVRDRDRFYTIVTAERGEDRRALWHPRLDPDDVLDVGPCLLRSRDPAVRIYWELQEARLAGILSRAIPRGVRPDRLSAGLARSRRILAALKG